MAATKKTTPKKAKASVKKTVAATATKPAAKRTTRKQPATAVQAVSYQETTFTLALVSLFAVLSVLFAVMAYWRYHL